MSENVGAGAETTRWYYKRRINNPVRLVVCVPWGENPDSEKVTWTLYRGANGSIFGEVVQVFKGRAAALLYAANNDLTIVAELRLNENWVARFDIGEDVV